jgi:AcrR family transcriptional regulator
MEIQKSSALRGRPRAFDAEEALDRALDVFWSKGYEGASLTDLTDAMGINRPSLYAAFGNKEALFHRVLDRYVEVTGDLMNDALSKPSVRAGMEYLLLGAAQVPSDGPARGCLLVKGALACSEASSNIQQELSRRRAAREASLRARFERAQLEGDLPGDASPADLAGYISVLLQGLSVQAAGGASGEELQRVVEVALRSWPT